MIVHHYKWLIPSPALEDLPESRSLHLQSPPDSGPHATRLDAGLQRRHMGWIQIRHRRGNSGEPKKGWCFIGGWGCGCWCLVWFKHGDLDLGELIFDDPIVSKAGWWGNMCKNCSFATDLWQIQGLFKEGNLRICKVLDKIQVCWVKRSWLFHIESLSPHCLLVCWERKAAIGEDQQAVKNIWWNR